MPVTRLYWNAHEIGNPTRFMTHEVRGARLITEQSALNILDVTHLRRDASLACIELLPAYFRSSNGGR